MPDQTLGQRLRALRLERGFKQDRVADALGVKPPSISAYERGTTVPKPAHLRSYAALFASPRWLDPDAPRRVTPDHLHPDERETFRKLNGELTQLAGRAAQQTATTTSVTPFWSFPDGADIRLFCGQLSAESAGRYASVDDHNYMRLRNAADLDSLFELWGHVRRLNPDSDVRYVLGSPGPDDLTGHVVVIGNIAQMQGAGRLMPAGTIPITQVVDDKLDGEVFEVDGVRYEPDIQDGRVVEDVGLIARVPNPRNSDHTLTICSGVFTRGVYGAVRALTDRRMRDSNADFLREHFNGSDSFALLTRVDVTGDTVITPELRVVRNRRYEWPTEAS
jgi:transcriptional regulator with XRE-family HTH domain